ncbi:hypothetical protein BLNAU_10987 [Blattamonas nauphoetae]|uniref:RRM domain-containing protein n=1 Tax=Blattamonas nauphoetae TaxID=2049346 RepID=A0ABQ9XSB4_9EUKA|nr:hypothetical protein BLNAU_10987 [Blattamonas nauphoetae]
MKETKWYCRYLVGSDPTGITGIKSEACPLELQLAPFSPECTEADILALIHPANPTTVKFYFPKNNENIKYCTILFSDARSTNAAFRDRSRWISKHPGLTVKFSARPNTQRASRSPPPTQLQSSSVYLTNLPNGVIPSDIINILFPTSIITNLLIHTAPPDQTVSAVVRFKTMSEAQQAISKSGSLVLLSNRIKVREDRAGGNRFSRGHSLLHVGTLNPLLHPHHTRNLLLHPHPDFSDNGISP